MIRLACRDDLDRIIEIELFVSRYNFRNIFSNDFLYKKLTFDYHKKWLSESFSNMENNYGIEYYVIEDENIVKGYFSIGFPEGTRECELVNIRIDVPFQNNKFGTLIMNYCFDLIKNRGKNTIKLMVFEKNEIAINFYKKFGFEIEDKYFSNELKIWSLKLKKHLKTRVKGTQGGTITPPSPLQSHSNGA